MGLLRSSNNSLTKKMCRRLVELGREAWATVLKKKIVSDPRQVLAAVRASAARCRVRTVIDVTDHKLKTSVLKKTSLHADAFVSHAVIQRTIKKHLHNNSVAIIMPLAPDDERPPVVAYMGGENGARLKSLELSHRVRARAVPRDGSNLVRASTNSAKGCAVYVLEQIFTHRQNDHLQERA